mmetsp:Transcript_35164/g.75930  ORF Transcript_35164/g.75930 Transcript_35164/m.75930 type:complete len:145 (+) Transcript_35164:312-746(+)
MFIAIIVPSVLEVIHHFSSLCSTIKSSRILKFDLQYQLLVIIHRYKLCNFPHSLRKLWENTRIRKHGQTRHRTTALIRLEKLVKRSSLLQVIRVGNPHHNFRTQKSMCRVKRWKDIARREDRVAHGGKARLGFTPAPRTLLGMT